MRYDPERSFGPWRSVLDRLRGGETILSLGIRHSRHGDVCRMASGAGYDLVWIDLEHSSLSVDAATQIAATGHDLGLGAWVRVPERDYAVIGRLLDGGVGGIIAPKVESAAEARELAAACRFPPAGRRSMLARLPHDGFVRRPPQELVAAANGAVVVQALIESPLGIENADAIAAVPGIDMLAVGTNDLSAELGCPGQVQHPTVVAACVRVAEAAARHGKVAVVGGVADDAHFRRLLGLGFAPLVFAGIDTDLLADALAQRAAAWRRPSAQSAQSAQPTDESAAMPARNPPA